MRTAESPGLQGLSTAGVEAGFLTKTVVVDIGLTPQAGVAFCSHRKSKGAANLPEFVLQTAHVAYPQLAQAHTS
jgi:hypothetical protein